MEKEVRYAQEIRANNDKGIIEGYALLFNTPSTGLPFVEIIEPGAVTEDTIRNSDVLALYDHNMQKGVLARSRYGKGSLHLEVDDRGLKYWFKVGKSSLHQELQENIERGEITASSFGFIVDDDEWVDTGTEVVRHIKSIKLLTDVSPVIFPAYDATVVTTRNADKYKELMEKRNADITSEIDKTKKQIDELQSEIKAVREEITSKIDELKGLLNAQKPEDLTEYYNNLKSQLNI